jgi:aldose 1-epimerase
VNAIKLETDRWSIEVSPDHGAAIVNCRYDGTEILRPAPSDWFQNPDPLASSCFPLVPFSNRINNGQFNFEGTDVELARNCDTEQHPIHGIGWQVPWQIENQSSTHCELTFEQPAFKKTVGAWPWAFRATQNIEIVGRQLFLSLAVTNSGQKNMPAGLGFHPYFNSAKTASLQFHAQGVWLSTEDRLPRKWVLTPEKWNFGNGKSLADIEIDHCITGWRGSARLSWDDVPVELMVKIDQQDGFAVVYVPSDDDYFCFEPVSHMSNAVNWIGKGDNTGLRVLAPNETMKFTMRLTVV